MLGHHASLGHSVKGHVLQAEGTEGKCLVPGHVFYGIAGGDILAPVEKVKRVAFGEHLEGHLQGVCRFHDAPDGKTRNDHQRARASSELGVFHFKSVGADIVYKFIVHAVKDRYIFHKRGCYFLFFCHPREHFRRHPREGEDLVNKESI